MPVKMPPNTALATERPVRANPVPVNYRPADSEPYRVTDLDTKDGWRGIARKHNLDVNVLINFNFKTRNPDEVNWYLRRNVGCNLATDDRMNWMFSTSAHPGIIYLPLKKIEGDGLVVEGRRTTSPLALEFEGPSSPIDKLGKFFDILQLVDVSLTIAGAKIGVDVLAMQLLGPVLGAAALMGLATAAQFAMIGGPHEAALNELRKKQILEGISLGIVLAADGRSPKWIEAHGFVKQWPVRDINYPQYGKQLQGLYNSSLVIGIQHGRQFNSVASKNLFVFLQAQMTGYAKKEFSGDPEKWDARKWQNYYDVCAGILRKKLKLN